MIEHTLGCLRRDRPEPFHLDRKHRLCPCPCHNEHPIHCGDDDCHDDHGPSRGGE